MELKLLLEGVRGGFIGPSRQRRRDPRFHLCSFVRKLFFYSVCRFDTCIIYHNLTYLRRHCIVTILRQSPFVKQRILSELSIFTRAGRFKLHNQFIFSKCSRVKLMHYFNRLASMFPRIIFQNITSLFQQQRIKSRPELIDQSAHERCVLLFNL